MPIWQAVWLADLLNGLDVPTRLKQYTHLSHFDVVTSLMSGLEGKNTANIVHDSECVWCVPQLTPSPLVCRGRALGWATHRLWATGWTTARHIDCHHACCKCLPDYDR